MRTDLTRTLRCVGCGKLFTRRDVLHRHRQKSCSNHLQRLSLTTAMPESTPSRHPARPPAIDTYHLASSSAWAATPTFPTATCNFALTSLHERWEDRLEASQNGQGGQSQLLMGELSQYVEGKAKLAGVAFLNCSKHSQSPPRLQSLWSSRTNLSSVYRPRSSQSSIPR
ncbi:hypothetical protein M427DRAFT_182911 [Gonapodya prolifera JEL478]|uniref:C2H2-type domain-containing protein n=1 Tax=Gonapodya prolifera (strain JEL478) TaxID=1344416 RepID=A0A139A0N9_GONPJ|nr:hypothetical protein M427DRAFT_182911 [Gonapodya prolifera JEL478]|eukprot:KXS10346.1 hypothetical protein M427DRAFT_182911 [Gonapodya prolifera JEL478]